MQLLSLQRHESGPQDKTLSGGFTPANYGGLQKSPPYGEEGPVDGWMGQYYGVKEAVADNVCPKI